MKKDYQNIKDGQNGILLMLKGMLGILFRPLLDIFQLFKEEFFYNIKNKKWVNLFKAVIPLSLIVCFLFYSFNSLYKDIYKYINYDRYEKILMNNYESEIEGFFKKYEERFAAHDCGFMREVGADELMYDKFGITSYGKEYNCTIFDSIQRIKILPLKIGKIEKFGNKFKVQGELIRVEITEGKPLNIAPIRFELWKTIDMDLWHFNLYGNVENLWIDSKFKKD